MIEVKGLQKAFGSEQVLKDVSFTVDKGETVAVIGYSGAGKSTMLRCLIDLEKADGGDVRLVDVNEDGVVSVELQGACKGCPMSQMTLANGVERILKERVPGVTKVVPADL